MGRYISIVILGFLLGFDNAQGSGCPSTLTCSVNLYCGGNRGSLISVHNEESQTSIIVDTENDMSMITNGAAGNQFIYDHRRGTGSQLKISQGSWMGSYSKYEEYVESIRSIKQVRISEEVKVLDFSIAQPPTDVLDMHYEIVQSLQPEMAEYGQIRRVGVYPMLINLIKEMSVISRQKLRTIIMSKMKMKRFLIGGGIMNVVSVFRGLTSLINATSGDLGTLIMNNQRFDMAPLFLSESGSETLALIADQIEDRNSQVFEIVRYPNRLYNVVREFSGGMYSNLRGVENLAIHLMSFLRKQTTLESFIDVLIQVSGQYKPIEFDVITRKIKYVENIIRNRLSQSLSQQILQPLELFEQNRLVVGEANIYTLVRQFMGGASMKIRSIIQLLHSLKINFMSSISTLFLRLSFFTVSGKGLYFVSRLLPSLKTLFDGQSTDLILEQISRNIQPGQIQMRLEERNVESIMQSIPGVRQIYESLTKELLAVNVEKRTFCSNVLKVGVLPRIVSWVKFGVGVTGGKPPLGCIHDIGLWGITGYKQYHRCRLFDEFMF